MNKPFHFDLKQTNTLRVSGLAAYVQRPPEDRIGWVLAQGVWLPEWRPKKWATQVQRIEVTWDSLKAVQAAEEAQLNFEPWDYYMVTDHELFLTDDMAEVERYFALYTDKPEFAQHPDHVQCPHEFNNHELSRDLPAHFNLKRRKLVRLLLHYQATGCTMTWDDGYTRIQGRVGHVHLASVDVTDSTGKQTSLWLGPCDSLHISVTEPDGYIRADWIPSCRPQGFDPASLPVWDFGQQVWVSLHDEPLS